MDTPDFVLLFLLGFGFRRSIKQGLFLPFELAVFIYVDGYGVHGFNLFQRNRSMDESLHDMC